MDYLELIARVTSHIQTKGHKKLLFRVPRYYFPKSEESVPPLARTFFLFSPDNTSRATPLPPPTAGSNPDRSRYLLCPAGHPKFTTQKGCNYLLRLSTSVRNTIDYGSQRFKSIYIQRSSMERGFSKLLALSTQNPTGGGLLATQNHYTIAHMTMLLVALSAHREGSPDKISFVKSCLPRHLLWTIFVQPY